MAAGDIYKKLRGVTNTLFQIGKGGPNLKNNGGVIEHRNAADAAFAIARGLDPVGNDDLVTLRYFNSNNAAAQGLTCVKMPLALVTKVSTSAIPDNATIFKAIIDVTTAYDASATLALKRTGDATKAPAATSDIDLQTIGTYEVEQVLGWGSTTAGTLTATIVGAATVGAAVIYIWYATPTDIT